MTADFETWLRQVAHRDEIDPGVRSAGAERTLREVFDRRGPISVEELEVEGRQIQMGLAQRAAALVMRDLHATTNVRPTIDVRHDQEHGLIVSYSGGYTTPALLSMQDPEATCEIADYLQSEIVEDDAVWTAWPTCRTHWNGLHAEVHNGAAVWYCRTGQHNVALIGQLAP